MPVEMVLTSFQVDDRQKQYGLNEMDQQEKESPLQIFLSQFKDLLVIVLIVAGFISMATGEIVSSIVIFYRYYDQCYFRNCSNFKS